jgi:hypothetical protein
MMLRIVSYERKSSAVFSELCDRRVKSVNHFVFLEVRYSPHDRPRRNVSGHDYGSGVLVEERHSKARQIREIRCVPYVMLTFIMLAILEHWGNSKPTAASSMRQPT